MSHQLRKYLHHHTLLMIQQLLYFMLMCRVCTKDTIVDCGVYQGRQCTCHTPRNNSLTLVLARVCASTFFTITAQ